MKRSRLTSLLAGATLLAALGFYLHDAVGADVAATTPAAPVSAITPRDPREPSRVPVSWELNFKHGTLERIILNVDGKDQTFWYMRYTVTNNSGRDVLFTPNFQIVAETGTVIDGYKDAPDGAFEKIKKLYGNPLLLSPINIDGKLLQGDDNAKDAVAIFPALDPNARNFKVFVMCLSGETSQVSNPLTGKPVILQKTLELDYNIPGQAIGIDPKPNLTLTTWVMK